MLCCLEPQRQHYIRFFLCRRYNWDNIARIKTLHSVVQEAPKIIAQIKTLCNVVLEAPDNSSQENVLFNVALKLFGRQCLSQNYVMFPERLYTTLHKKTPVQCFLDNLVSTLNRSKPYAMFSERVQTPLHMKKFCSMLS